MYIWRSDCALAPVAELPKPISNPPATEAVLNHIETVRPVGLLKAVAVEIYWLLPFKL